MDVHLDFQKQGIGRQLIEYAIDSAKRNGFVSVSLTTFAYVAWNRPFYEKLGFQMIDQCDLPMYLQNALDNEVSFGFSRESRCAMRLVIK